MTPCNKEEKLECLLLPANDVVFTIFTRKVPMNASLLIYSRLCKWKISESSKFTRRDFC